MRLQDVRRQTFYVLILHLYFNINFNRNNFNIAVFHPLLNATNAYDVYMFTIC
jgi:hypothetical protein